MEKLINSAFDFFAYALPGAFIILSLLILDERNDTVQDYLNFAQNLKAGGAAVLLAAGYVLGFVLTPLGRKMYRKFQKGGIFKKMNAWLEGGLEKVQYDFDDDTQPDKKMPISEKYVLVREYSPLNFRHIESWHVYSLMSHNMAMANIAVCLFVVIRLAAYRPDHPWLWIFVLSGALIFFLLFLYSAAKFNIWSMNEQNAAIQALQLRLRTQQAPASSGSDSTHRQP